MDTWSPRAVVREFTIDAIVVVPGIMGSVLHDVERGTIWGFSNPTSYLPLWTSGAALKALALTEWELDDIASGTYETDSARVRPAGLLRFSAFAPVTGGFEPYTRLVKALKERVAHPDAVLEFSYDWRLPVRLNSQRLAWAMKSHLAKWRTHEAYAEARRIHPDQRDAELVIVAHSMGGLVARGLGDARIEDGMANVRQVITLGTPFKGSVKSAVMLTQDGDMPLLRRRFHDVIRTMPGLYDLLPRDRCLLVDREDTDEVVALGTDDVVAIGGRRDLAELAERDYATSGSISLPCVAPVVGVFQPTWQSLQIHAGVVEPAFYHFDWDSNGELMLDEIGRPRLFDSQGDGTVWRYAAVPEGYTGPTSPVAQQHGALASSGGTIGSVLATLVERKRGESMGGDGQAGLVVPDVADVGSAFDVIVTGEADPSNVECQVANVETHEPSHPPTLRKVIDEGRAVLRGALTLFRPGLFRIGVKGKSGDWVTQIVMITTRRD